jgi:hypothetical protein
MPILLMLFIQVRVLSATHPTWVMLTSGRTVGGQLSLVVTYSQTFSVPARMAGVTDSLLKVSKPKTLSQPCDAPVGTTTWLKSAQAMLFLWAKLFRQQLEELSF